MPHLHTKTNGDRKKEKEREQSFQTKENKELPQIKLCENTDVHEDGGVTLGQLSTLWCKQMV